MVDTKERNAELIQLAADTDMTYAAIAEHIGEKYRTPMTRQRAQQLASRAGVDRKDQRGRARHPLWKGDRYVEGGQVYVRDGNGRPVLEHKKVMARKLGRRLKSNERVWHRDGDEANNDPDNLELVTVGEFSSRKNRKYDRDALLRMYRWVALEVGHTPTTTDIAKLAPVCPPVLYTYFTSLAALARAAGLSPNAPFTPAKKLLPGFRTKYGYLRRRYSTSAKALGHG